jgi:hypothetical protein
MSASVRFPGLESIGALPQQRAGAASQHDMLQQFGPLLVIPTLDGLSAGGSSGAGGSISTSARPVLALLNSAGGFGHVTTWPSMAGGSPATGTAAAAASGRQDDSVRDLTKILMPELPYC